MNDLEFRQLLPRGMDEILRLQRRLNSALDHLDTLPDLSDAILEAPQVANEAVEQTRGDLEIARESVLNIRDRLIELARLIERLVAQRQSAAEAYEAGYEERYVDLIAQLSSAEYFALRQALADLGDGDPIPF